MSFQIFSRSHFQNFLSHSRERLAFGIAIGIMSKKGQGASSSDDSPLEKARPTNLVMRRQCKENISNQRLGSLVNPENYNKQERIAYACGNRVADDYNLGVEYSQVKRPEKVKYAQGDLEQGNQTRSNERSISTRGRVASLPELKNMEYTNHLYMKKVSQILQNNWGEPQLMRRSRLGDLLVQEEEEGAACARRTAVCGVGSA